MRKLHSFFIPLLFLLGCGQGETNPKDDAVAQNVQKAVTRKLALNPEFPVVEGNFDLPGGWSLALPGPFNLRLEKSSIAPGKDVRQLVFWRPGITAWLCPWDNNKKESREARLKLFRGDISAEAFAIEEYKDGSMLRFGYRLNESRDQGIVYAFYGLAFGDSGHLQIAIYFDNEADLELARALWRSMMETSPKSKGSVQ